MTQWGFYFDQTRCYGCKTCTVACKEWNEGRRGDAKINELKDLPQYETPEKWQAGSDESASNLAMLRKFDMKETWRRVTFAELGDNPPNVEIAPLSISCNHCENPACIPVCPVKAITKEPEFGAVIVDSSKCIGCGSCAKACPWGAPQYYEDLSKTAFDDPKHPKMTKCDMCIDRLKQGLKPACVAACIGRALECGPIEALRKRHPDATITALGFEPGNTKPCILFKSRTFNPGS